MARRATSGHMIAPREIGSVTTAVSSRRTLTTITARTTIEMRRLLGLSPFILLAVIWSVRPLEPYEWGHRLGTYCQWREGPVAAFLGRDDIDQAGKNTEFACWASHGAKDPEASPTVRVLVRKFPKQEN